MSLSEMERDHPYLVQHSRLHTKWWRAYGDFSSNLSKSDSSNPSVYHSGEYLSEVGDIHDISVSSASHIITTVTSVLCEFLDNEKFPFTNADLEKVKEEFY